MCSCTKVRSGFICKTILTILFSFMFHPRHSGFNQNQLNCCSCNLLRFLAAANTAGRTVQYRSFPNSVLKWDSLPVLSRGIHSHFPWLFMLIGMLIIQRITAKQSKKFLEYKEIQHFHENLSLTIPVMPSIWSGPHRRNSVAAMQLFMLIVQPLTLTVDLCWPLVGFGSLIR